MVQKNITPIASTSETNTGFRKRMTVAELFMKESEKDMKKSEEGTEVTQTIDKFDKMDLYKSIFLSDSEEEEPPPGDGKSDVTDFIDKPKNIHRNTSPPRGIFANIDFDELNSWKRNVDTKKPDAVTDSKKDPSNAANAEKNNDYKKVDSEKELEAYGPKIPDSLKKRLEETVPEKVENFRPIFRSKSEIETESNAIEIDSSSSADSWVDVRELKSKNKKEKKKKNKKHKSKHKKSKHKKKDR